MSAELEGAYRVLALVLVSCVSFAVVINCYKCNGLKQLIYSLTVLEVRNLRWLWQGCILSGDSRKEPMFLPFLTSVGCLHFLARGPTSLPTLLPWPHVLCLSPSCLPLIRTLLITLCLSGYSRITSSFQGLNLIPKSFFFFFFKSHKVTYGNWDVDLFGALPPSLPQLPTLQTRSV